MAHPIPDSKFSLALSELTAAYTALGALDQELDKRQTGTHTRKVKSCYAEEVRDIILRLSAERADPLQVVEAPHGKAHEDHKPAGQPSL